MIQLKHITMSAIGIIFSFSAMAQNMSVAKLPIVKSPWSSSLLSINEYSAEALNENDSSSDHLLFAELRYAFSPAFTLGYRQLFTYSDVRNDQSSIPVAEQTQQENAKVGDGNFVTAFKKFKFLGSNGFAPEIRYYLPLSKKSQDDKIITKLEYASFINWSVVSNLSFTLSLKPNIQFYEEKDATVRFYQTGNLGLELVKGHSIYAEMGTDTRYADPSLKQKSQDSVVTEIGYSGDLTSNFNLNLYAGNNAKTYKPKYDFMLYAYDETVYGLLMKLSF